MEISPYMPTIWAMGTTGFLILVQILVVDVAGLRAGHKPGAPVEPDSGSFVFRATRAHANTNETVAIFVLFAIAGVLSDAPASWLNYTAWGYVASRVVHMLAYYAGRALVRSVAFALSLVCLFAMFVAISMSWLA